MSIPLWFVVAVVGHLANASSFIIDKILLRKSFRRPATYAGIVGATGALAVVLFPFGVAIPDAWGWFWMILSGTTFVVSLLLFFGALAAGEASRVVPIIGSLIPVLTLIGTSTLFGERLSTNQLIGFALLVASTIILAGGAAHTRMSRNAIILAVTSAALFAVSSVAAKAGYDGYGFVTSFTWSRLAGVVAAVAILIWDPKAEKEFAEAVHPHGVHGHAPTAAKVERGHKAVWAFVIGQSLGALGFLGVQIALSLGSAALVNALQAVQYVLLVAVALLLRNKAHLLGEDLTHRTIMRKLFAIFVVGVGLWLVM
jgi:uncharacterized membrane protein